MNPVLLPQRRVRDQRRWVPAVGASLLAVASLALGAVAPAAQAAPPSTSASTASASAATASAVPSVGPATDPSVGLDADGSIPTGAPTLQPSDLPPTPGVTPTSPEVAPESCLGACPPGNDNFVDAVTVTGYTGTAYGTNAGASSQPYEPIIEGGGHETVWYSWEAPSSGDVTFDLCLEASGFDSLLGAYTGSTVNALTVVAENDDTCGSSSQITFAAAGGTTYSIQVDSYFDAPGSTKGRVEGVTGGTFYLHWNLPEPAYSLGVADMSAAEGDGKTTYFDFTVTLSSESPVDVSVGWATSDGTALAPDDYSASSGTAVVPAGALTTVFTVDVNGDLDHESDETFNVSLSEPDGAVLGDATATGTIANDDLAADLFVYLDTFGGKAEVGGYINYIAQVFNPAGGDSAAVVVNAEVPANTTLDYAYASQGTCAPGVPVVCSLGDIAAGGSAYVVMYVVPSRTGVYRTSVTVSSNLVDPDPTDNTDRARKTVFADDEGCTVVGTAAADRIIGTPGDDVICARAGDDFVNGRDGNDIVRGGLGNDALMGGPGYDQLNGESGEDTLTGGSDFDAINGGGGVDTVSYATSPSGVSVDLAAGTAVDGFTVPAGVAGGGETLDSVNTVIGSGFDDVLNGAEQHDALYGGSGDDGLFGYGGADTLDGGDGTDTVDGGAAVDTCTGETVSNCEG